MKIKEILAQWLERTELFEMAFSRQEAWKRVSSLAHPLSMHILKILIMPDAQDVSHWKSEISSWLDDMEDIILKPQNRRLSFNEYREWLINQPELMQRRADKLVRCVRGQYPQERIMVPETLLLDFQDILLSMCHDLANYSVKENINEYFK